MAPSLLGGLPSRGYLTTYTASTNKRIPVYICEHNTDPPADQKIKNDTTNILIRNLIRKRERISSAKSATDRGQGNDLSNRSEKTGDDMSDVKGKRPAGSAAEGDSLSAKKAALMNSSNAGASGSSTGSRQNSVKDFLTLSKASTRHFTEPELRGMTMEALKDQLLKMKQPAIGRKDELIKKILEHQRGKARAVE